MIIYLSVFNVQIIYFSQKQYELSYSTVPFQSFFINFYSELVCCFIELNLNSHLSCKGSLLWPFGHKSNTLNGHVLPISILLSEFCNKLIYCSLATYQLNCFLFHIDITNIVLSMLLFAFWNFFYRPVFTTYHVSVLHGKKHTSIGNFFF